jgi:hypothetical protein
MGLPALLAAFLVRKRDAPGMKRQAGKLLALHIALIYRQHVIEVECNRE